MKDPALTVGSQRTIAPVVTEELPPIRKKKVEPGTIELSVDQKVITGPQTGSINDRGGVSGSTLRNTAQSVDQRVSFSSVVATALETGKPLERGALEKLLHAIDGLDENDRRAELKLLKASHPEVAEALLLFAARDPSELGTLGSRTNAMMDHLAINSDAAVNISGPFTTVMQQARRYGKTAGVDNIMREGTKIFAKIGGKKVELLPFDATLTPAEQLKAIGRAINQYRFGNEQVIPPQRIALEPTEGYSSATAYWSAQLSKLAYSDPKLVEAQARAWGFTDFKWVEDKGSDTQAFVVSNAEMTIVTFRGSSSLEDFKNDALIGRIDRHGGSVHAGMQRALDATWAELQKALDEIGGDKPILFTGHSLGGGLATLAAAQYAENGGKIAGVYLYGTPRVGDEEFVAAYNEKLGDKTFLHINDRDIVTRVPPGILGYVEVGRERRIFDNEGALRIEQIEDAKARAQLASMEAAPIDREAIERELDEAVAAARRATEEAQSGHAAPPVMHDAATLESFKIQAFDDHGSQHYLRISGRQMIDEMFT